MKKTIKIIIFLFGFNVIYAGEILELQGKKLNFFLDTSKCSFYLENPYPVDNRSRLLLFRDNPPTSYISFYIDGSYYRFSEKDIKLNEPFYLYGNYIKGEFEAKNIKFTLYFILTNLGKKGFEDTLLTILQVENTSTNNHSLDIRFLFDTVIGEEDKHPYIYTIGGEKIEFDRIFEEGKIPAIFSGRVEVLDKEFKDGLYIFPTINNFAPKRLIIGNWKKLNIMRNIFLPEPKARFRYNPYSNPDAAVYTIYRFKLSAKEKLSFGCTLSIDKIPEEKLIYKEESPITETKAIEFTKDEPKLEEKKVETTSISIVSNTSTTSNTNELDLLKEKLLLYKKLNSLIDKIEEKFLSTNLYEKETKIQSQVTPPIIVITNFGGNVDTNQIEQLNREILRLQKDYENRLKELQNHSEAITKEEKKDEKKEEIKVKPERSIKNKNKDKDIDKKIKEIDKSLLLLEKLIKLNLTSLPQEKINELKINIANIEKEINK